MGQVTMSVTTGRERLLQCILEEHVQSFDRQQVYISFGAVILETDTSAVTVEASLPYD